MSLLDSYDNNRPARFATDAEWQQWCDEQNALPQHAIRVEES